MSSIPADANLSRPAASDVDAEEAHPEHSSGTHYFAVEVESAGLQGGLGEDGTVGLWTLLRMLEVAPVRSGHGVVAGCCDVVGSEAAVVRQDEKCGHWRVESVIVLRSQSPTAHSRGDDVLLLSVGVGRLPPPEAGVPVRDHDLLALPCPRPSHQKTVVLWKRGPSPKRKG
jgi:hypothetical protein